MFVSVCCADFADLFDEDMAAVHAAAQVAIDEIANSEEYLEEELKMYKAQREEFVAEMDLLIDKINSTDAQIKAIEQLENELLYARYPRRPR